MMLEQQVWIQSTWPVKLDLQQQPTKLIVFSIVWCYSGLKYVRLKKLQLKTQYF